MTNKLVVIINSLKVPKIKKILLYEMKFLVPNYSCHQNPWLGGYRPQIPVLSVLNWICWTPSPPNKIPRVRHWIRVYKTVRRCVWKRSDCDHAVLLKHTTRTHVNRIGNSRTLLIRLATALNRQSRRFKLNIGQSGSSQTFSCAIWRRVVW